VSYALCLNPDSSYDASRCSWRCRKLLDESMNSDPRQIPALSFPQSESTLETSDYVIFLESSDWQGIGQSAGPSACLWQIRTMVGTIVHDGDAKRSRTERSDEKRGLVAALVGALEMVGDGSFCLVYANGTYIEDGVYYARDWKAHGWRNTQNQQIANPELWDRFLELLDTRQLTVWARIWSKNNCVDLRRSLKRKARRACGGRV
jgi:ribonuclease HI